MQSTRRDSVFSVELIGDSTLQLNKSKGTTGFDAEFQQSLQQFLKSYLPNHVGVQGRVNRNPGATGSTLLQLLEKTDACGVDCVGLVWMLTDLCEPCSPDALAVASSLASRLALSMQRFSHKFAVIGGSSELWGVGESFDEGATEIRCIFESYGIPTVDGVDLYLNSGLTYKKGEWHIKTDSTGHNKAIMGSYYAGLVKKVVQSKHAQHILFER